MQKLLIVLIVVLNCSQNVKSSFISFMFNAFNELKTDISSFFSEVSRRVFYKLYSSSLSDVRYVKVNRPIILHREGAPGHDRPGPGARPSPAARLAAEHGRPLQEHIVYTSDGYILTLHRLLGKKTGRRDQGTVLLHHGLLGSSIDWLLLGATKSLPYLLSDAGYDVWLANARGNYYSRAHLFRSRRSRDFWDFSWQEIGERDLPAILNYISETTNCSEGINFVGHGMGATALLVLLSVKPEYSESMKVVVLLAPLAMMAHAQGPLAELADFLDEMLPAGEYLTANQVAIPVTEKYCVTKSLLCQNSLFILTGALLQNGYTHETFISQLLHNVPAGGSSKTIKHYAQLIKHKKFHKFGKVNEEFNLRDINTSIAIFSSSEDLISTIIDNQNLFNSLPNPIGHIIFKNKNISHTEFVWGLNADKEIFPKIVDLIEHGPDGPDVNKVEI